MPGRQMSLTEVDYYRLTCIMRNTTMSITLMLQNG